MRRAWVALVLALAGVGLAEDAVFDATPFFNSITQYEAPVKGFLVAIVLLGLMATVAWLVIDALRGR